MTRRKRKEAKALYLRVKTMALSLTILQLLGPEFLPKGKRLQKHNPRNNHVHVIQVQARSEIKVQLLPQAALCKGTRIDAVNNVS